MAKAAGKSIIVDGVSMTLVRRKGAKSIRISVSSPECDVRICAPYGVPERDIVRFAGSKLPWVRERIRAISSRPYRPPAAFAEGELFTLWGEPAVLRFADGPRAPEPACGLGVSEPSGGSKTPDPIGASSPSGGPKTPDPIDGADGSGTSSPCGGDASHVPAPAREFLLPVSADASPERRRSAFWKALARELEGRLRGSVAAHEASTGLRCAGWTVRNMRSRWGSCTIGSGRIRFSTRLALYPPECMEMVVVHELGHLAHPDHGPAFKSYMDAYYPDWRRTRGILK